MKKTFLALGILAFTSVSAQQKEVFDVNRHIQQVLRTKNTPGTREKTFETYNVLMKNYA